MLRNNTSRLRGHSPFTRVTYVKVAVFSIEAVWIVGANLILVTILQTHSQAPLYKNPASILCRVF